MYALFNLVLLYCWIVQTKCQNCSAPQCQEYDLNLNGEKKDETYTWVFVTYPPFMSFFKTYYVICMYDILKSCFQGEKQEEEESHWVRTNQSLFD